jgi:hypothetical protein
LGVTKTRKIKKVTTSQDDGLVGVLKQQSVGREKMRKIKKSQALRMTILREFEEKHPKQVGAHGP